MTRLYICLKISRIDAVKIGMVSSIVLIETIAGALKKVNRLRS